MPETTAKDAVRDFWNRGSCGEVYATGENEREQYEAHRKARYELEPYIYELARFAEGAGKDVLEIGVGMGADHVEWAKAGPKSLSGIDLTQRAIDHTRRRLGLYGLQSNLNVGDAENLPFPDNSFDIVYSFGVIHCSPDTPKAVEEIRRVLRPGGEARVLIYHLHSVVNWMLWVRYGLLRGRPGRTLLHVCSTHLESPGTKAYTEQQTHEMFRNFRNVKTEVRMSFGDLLEGEVGQQHRGILLSTAKAIWPRWFIKRFLKKYGNALLIEAVK